MLQTGNKKDQNEKEKLTSCFLPKPYISVSMAIFGPTPLISQRSQK